jgi:hypothetical protein
MSLGESWSSVVVSHHKRYNLIDPVPWGIIASSNVALMTPPAYVLEAALLDNMYNHSTEEVAYVVVMKRRPRTPRPPPPPQFRLVIEGDELDPEPLGLNTISPHSTPKSTTTTQRVTISKAVDPKDEAAGSTTTRIRICHPVLKDAVDDDDHPTTTTTTLASATTCVTQNNSAITTPPPLLIIPSCEQQLLLAVELEPVLENNDDDDEEEEEEEEEGVTSSVVGQSDTLGEKEQNVESTNAAPGAVETSIVSAAAAAEPAVAPPPEPAAIAAATTTTTTTTPATDDDDDANATVLASQILYQLVASEKQSRKLELQLRQSGVSVVTAEDISYIVAKQKIAEIAARMNAIGDTSAEYFTLEQEMEKYSTAIVLTDEYHQELEMADQQWEEANAAANAAALDYVRRHMPVEIRLKTVDELVTALTANVAPGELLKRFKRTNGITLLRVNPIAIERMHPSTLENMRTTGLTLTERRALYAHLRPVGRKWQARADAMMERKYSWFTMLKNNFREALRAYELHVRQYDQSPDGVSCQCRFPRTCPVVADALIGYSVTGAGQPAAAEYEPMEVMASQRGSDREPQSAAEGVASTTTTMTITKNEEQAVAATADAAVTKSKRREELRKFYKGSMRNFSDANAACETMDDLVDNITYQTAQWVQEADGVTLIGKMKGLSSEVKVALQTLISTRFRPVVATTAVPASRMEYDLLQKVLHESVVLCDAIEERVKRLEMKLVHADTKGTVITTSAIRLLVEEISALPPLVRQIP